MRNILYLIALLLVTQCTRTKTDSVAQKSHGEFVVYDNGLIYDTPTMSKLSRAVDSLNLRFKQCESKSYRSLEQGYGTFISITENVRRARKALGQDMELETFLKKFPAAEVKRNLWIVKQRTAGYEKPAIEYRSEGEDYLYIEVPDSVRFDKTTGWIYDDHDDHIEIFYLHKLKSEIIPVEYARLIQYVDCMIDTTATIFPKEEKPDSLVYFLGSGSKVKEFVDLAMDFEKEPKEPETDANDPHRVELYEQYHKDMGNWNMRRMASLDQKMQDQSNLQLLREAVEESITSQNGFYLDEYAARYLSTTKALELKRSFRVHGFCSADTRPREHAQAICKLAAETYQWDIFLRAHLDILNDNFERSSDGSYAWKRRGTYIKELEELGINTVNLLVGTTLNSKDVSENHYQASTSRTGRALTESKNKAEAENFLISMIIDERLDLYNRMEMAYVLIHYNRSLNDKQTYEANLKRIKNAIETLPGELHKRYARLIPY